MDKSEMALFEAQAEIMKALSHPTRLFIAHQLGQGEKCVGELTEMVGADTSTISKHLSILKNAGIVGTEKRGTSIYYTLTMRCVLNFFVCVNKVLKKRVDSQLVFVE
jgi:DNA-binding transcriptional ArsR family regulator